MSHPRRINDPRTKHYIERRLTEGRNEKEADEIGAAVRCPFPRFPLWRAGVMERASVLTSAA